MKLPRMIQSSLLRFFVWTGILGGASTTLPVWSQDFTPVGKLELKSSLKGSLYLDGQKKLVLQSGGTEILSGIPEGNHVVEVAGSGGTLLYQGVAIIRQGTVTTLQLTENPSLANESYYTASSDFTQNYRNPLEKLKKEELALLETVRKQIANQQYDAALASLQTLLAADPESPVANYYRGVLYLNELQEASDPAQRSRLLEATQAAFEFGTRKARPFAYSFAGMAHYHAIQRDLPKVYENGYLAEQLDGSNTDLLVKLAEAYSASRSLRGINSATRLLTKAAAAAPDNADILVATGDVYFLQEIAEIPLNYYQQALAKDPNSVRAHYRLGQYHIAQKAYSEGNAALTKAIGLDPAFAPAYIELGELYYRISDFVKAKDYYRKYVELRGNDLTARYRYTLFLYLSKDYPGAIQEIQTVLKDTATSVLLRLMTYSAVEAGNIPLARETYTRYVESWKPNALIAKDYEYSGKLQIAEGDFDAGAQDVLRCLELDPSRTDLVTYLVTLFGREKKDYARAAKFQAIATEYDPSLYNYTLLASFYKASQQEDKSFATFQNITQKFPENIQGWLNLGDLQLKRDQADPENPTYEAKPYYDKVIELAEPNPAKNIKELVRAYYYQAYYQYASLGDREQSIAYCDKALALDSAYKPALDLKAQCLQDLGN